MPQKKKVISISAHSATSKWYELKMAAQGRATIEIRGTIGISQEYREWGMDAAGTVLEFEAELKALGDVADIDLYIYSLGGYVWDALAIHDILVRHPARIHAHVDGLAASAATVVLMAADTIEVPANAYLMIHNAAGCVCGDHREMQKAAAMLAKFSRDIANLYVTRIEDSAASGEGFDRAATLGRVMTMMDEETWLTGQEALALGLADSVTGAVEIAASAMPLADMTALTRTMSLDRMPAPVRALFDTTAQTQDHHSPTITPTNMSDPVAPVATPAPAAAPAPAPAAPTAAAPAPAAPVASAPAAAPSVAPATAPTAAAPSAPAPLSPDAGGAAQPAAAPTNAAPTGPVTMEGLATLLTNTIAPLQAQITALQGEVDTQKNLAAAGVKPTAWGGGQPPAPAPLSGNPTATPTGPVNFAEVNPRALIKQGREAMHKKD